MVAAVDIGDADEGIGSAVLHPARRRLDQRLPGGHRHQAVGRVEDLLGVRAVALHRQAVERRHAVTDLPAGDALAHRVDHPGRLVADGGGKADRAEAPGAVQRLDAVETERADTDAHLAWARRGDRHLIEAQHLGSAERVYADDPGHQRGLKLEATARLDVLRGDPAPGRRGEEVDHVGDLLRLAEAV